LLKIKMMEVQSVARQKHTLNLLPTMAELPVTELEVYLIEISALIGRKQTTDSHVRERVLLDKITQTVLSRKKTQRYQDLVHKLEFETMTDAEHAEFMRVANEEAKLRNLRVKYLIELAQLRTVALPQLMKDLGLNKAQNA
jgi:hypothetical protein